MRRLQQPLHLPQTHPELPRQGAGVTAVELGVDFLRQAFTLRHLGVTHVNTQPLHVPPHQLLCHIFTPWQTAAAASSSRSTAMGSSLLAAGSMVVRGIGLLIVLIATCAGSACDCIGFTYLRLIGANSASSACLLAGLGAPDSSGTSGAGALSVTVMAWVIKTGTATGLKIQQRLHRLLLLLASTCLPMCMAACSG